jgi:MFS transporter, DHA1 family, inner membrane transport protein
LLVSVYALGIAVGGPAVVAITASQSRKRTLLQLCAIFIVGHALAALAPDYGLLIGARTLAALSRASFLGIATIVAAASVPSERSARAVSLVWLGFSAASLVGAAGAQKRSATRSAGARRLLDVGGGWRSRGTGSSALDASGDERGKATGLGQEIVALRRPQVLLATTMSLLVCASTFAVFTFVAPILPEETRISAEFLPLMLPLFGVGGAGGMVVGGVTGANCRALVRVERE